MSVIHMPLGKKIQYMYVSADVHMKSKGHTDQLTYMNSY